MDGGLSGSLSVGSRTPVENAPSWATLEVVTGGFATGQLLAGGPLKDHEKAMLAGAALSESNARQKINGFFLTDEGLAQLQELLRTGLYDIELPEEGALLVVAWLVQKGLVDEARSLLEHIAPFFSRLRFYPIPAEAPRLSGSRVCLQDVRTTIESLKNIRTNQRLLAQKEAVTVWAPLYDRTVGLFLETVEGASPDLSRGPDGSVKPVLDGRFPVEGGWPCSRYPEGWVDKAKAVLLDYEEQRRKHQFCGKPDRAKDSFAQLRKYLQTCIRGPEKLTGRDVGRIRLILARYVAKHGAPGSAGRLKLREEQLRHANAPTFKEVANALIPRLRTHPGDRGLDDVSTVTRPIGRDEATHVSLPEGTAIPGSLQKKVQRCLSETVDVLVEQDIVTSGETLARVLPQMTSGIRAAGIADPLLRQLYSAVYRAFRRRRSLLLLDLQSQVKIEELPWVAAIDRFRHEDMSARELARQTLEEVVALTISSFPYALLPNKLLQELRALAKTAEMDLPLVDELAADIFMGKFSGKFLQAANKAAEVLDGTLYGTYYGIDFKHVRSLSSGLGAIGAWFKKDFDPLIGLCESRAGVHFGAWDAAINGMIIEQQQILTTQNLAVLFDALRLADVMRGQLGALARRCFVWICQRQQMKIDRWHARLIMVKNTAYAWRQMVFFLSLAPSGEMHDFLAWAEQHLSRQAEAFQEKFHPVLTGLLLASSGCAPDSQSGGQRFLGWSKSKHWLLQ